MVKSYRYKPSISQNACNSLRDIFSPKAAKVANRSRCSITWLEQLGICAVFLKDQWVPESLLTYETCNLSDCES